MRRPAARHVRTSIRRPHRSLRTLLAAVVSVTVLPVVAAVSVPHAAQASALCLVPQVTEVMVSQGLPSYDSLTRGKRALVRYSLATPSCAPSTTVLEVVSGKLDISVWPEGAAKPAQPTGQVAQLTSTAPGGAAPPASVGPLPSYRGDALFVVPGELLLSSNAKRLSAEFVATLQYKVNGGPAQPLVTGATTKTVERPSNPLRVLVVPMGKPTEVGAAFPAAARRAVHNGMQHLARILPVADTVQEMNPAAPTRSSDVPLGIRYAINPGVLDISTYMPASAPRFCGSAGQFDVIEAELIKARDAYNTALAAAGRTQQNPALRADVVLGVVWRGISRGPLTGETGSGSCIEGYARVGGVAAWSRLVGPLDENDQAASVSGALSAMEIIHLFGGTSGEGSDGNFHAQHDEADISAPNRAWNTALPAHIPDDRDVMKFNTSGWNDSTTLLSKRDYAYVQCFLTPLLPGESVLNHACSNPGSIGGRYGVAAGLEAEPSGTREAIYLSGLTDGTRAGTDVRSYVEFADTDEPVAHSSFHVVQSMPGKILTDDPVPVWFERSAHPEPTEAVSPKGALSVALPLHPDAQLIQLVHIDAAGKRTELYARSRSAAPRIVGAAIDQDAVTVTVEDDGPAELLRLDVAVKCDGVAYPVITDLAGSPVFQGARTVVFKATYQGSNDCPLGLANFRVTDGFSSTAQDANPRTGPGTPFAAIYTPAPGAELTPDQVVTLTGAARDAQGRAARLEWSVTSARGTTTYTDRSVVLREPLEPGAYDVRLRAFDALGREVASTRTGFAVLSDADSDGIADRVETQICATGARVDVPWQDADGDARPNSSDPVPCVSSHAFSVSFGAQTLNAGSNGLPVTMHVTGDAPTIAALAAQDVFIDQVGYYGLDTSGCPHQNDQTCLLPATRVETTGATTATVKFNRSALTQFITAKGLSGYIPVVLATSGGLRGSDPTYPIHVK